MTDSKLRRMMLKGKEYREFYELEYFGEEMELPIRPLKDTEFLELLERIDNAVDDDQYEEMMEDMDEDVNPEDLDEGDFDIEFIEIMRDAAKLGIDHEAVGETQEGINEIVDELTGGVSIDIGSEVMDITSDLQDAQKFRGRGSGN